MVGNRESLKNPMVCNGHSCVSPVFCPLNYLFNINYTVHVAHHCVKMKLDTFLQGSIHSFCSEIRNGFHSRDGTDTDFFIEFIKNSHAFEFIETAFLQIPHKLRKFIVFYKDLTGNRICKICNLENDNSLADSGNFLRINISKLSADYNLSDFIHNLGNRSYIAIHIFSKKYIRIRHTFLLSKVGILLSLVKITGTFLHLKLLLFFFSLRFQCFLICRFRNVIKLFHNGGNFHFELMAVSRIEGALLLFRIVESYF